MTEILTDNYGWQYYRQLPEDYRPAVLADFHKNGRLNLGMVFLIRWVRKEYYQICKVSERLSGSFLKPFIDDGRVFIKSDTGK